MRFATFPFHLSKVLRLPWKSEARSRSCEVLHMSRKIILANLKALRKSALWPPNISDEHVSSTLPGTQNASLLFKCPTPVNAFKTAISPHVLLTFDKVHNPLRLPRETTSERPKVEHGVFYTFWLCHVLRATMACTFSTSQLPKVVRPWCALYILTSTCASCHNGVHFFIISISKSGPTLVCFVHFDLEMCFAPQRRALFRHLNFQKWSDHGVFCTFCLGNVLRATAACNFSSLIWPAGSAPAALASLLFDPLEPQIIGKTQCFATFLPFRAPWLFLFSDLLSSSLLFSSLLFSSLIVFTSAFHVSILSEVWL